MTRYFEKYLIFDENVIHLHWIQFMMIEQKIFSNQKRKRYQYEPLHKIQQGYLEIKLSSLGPSAGFGLWTGPKTFYRKGDYITEYDGEIITRKEALELKKNGSSSHCRSLGIGSDLVINGDFNPFDFTSYLRGAGAFINDIKDKTKYNAEFVNLDTLVGVKRKGKYQTLTRVFIRAIKFIPPNHEIFINYGKDFWNF